MTNRQGVSLNLNKIKESYKEFYSIKNFERRALLWAKMLRAIIRVDYYIYQLSREVDLIQPTCGEKDLRISNQDRAVQVFKEIQSYKKDLKTFSNEFYSVRLRHGMKIGEIFDLEKYRINK